MIARLTLSMGPRTVIALLGRDLTWQCEDLLTQSFLNSCYGPPDRDKKATAAAGYAQAHGAAKAVEAAGWDVNLYIPALNQSAA